MTAPTMTVRYEIDGNTYDVREAIKSDGWRWDGHLKVWYRSTLEGTRKQGQFRGCRRLLATVAHHSDGIRSRSITVEWTSKTYERPGMDAETAEVLAANAGRNI